MNKKAPTKSVRASRQGLSMREALLFCKERGRPLSHPGLRYIAKTNRFLFKASDGYHWMVDRIKLEAYLKHASETPPEGWFTIHDCAKKLGVSPKTIYVWIERYPLMPRFFGAGKGVIHLELNHVRRTLGLN